MKDTNPVFPEANDNTEGGLISVDSSREIANTDALDLNLIESIQVSIEKQNAIGRTRMVIADFLIEKGLMKRKFR